jgi:predicted small metal-binding protein
MVSISCAELGGEGCDHKIEGETAEEVEKNLYEHAAEVHPDKVKDMSDEDKGKMHEMIVQKFNEKTQE